MNPALYRTPIKAITNKKSFQRPSYDVRWPNNVWEFSTIFHKVPFDKKEKKKKNTATTTASLSTVY